MTGVRGQERRRSPGERGSDGLLETRLDLELRERQQLPPPQARGQQDEPFALVERPLERGEPVASGTGALRHIVALDRRRAGSGPRIVCASFELGRAGSAAASVRTWRPVLLAESTASSATLS